ncbi:BON domain-containing protein [Paraburkholderia sp. BL21I4N1]|uniref:BON domain-containing protein n=1 Tax=Paraburkholderia sp. BL21I4N1 TaxID=1938801 RepID=UPI000D46E477|nr:BON domain-containing protein [Paraburkholderia sp. BL21I4N1]PQV50091.1 BON domain-containing protein [Paraburkholderia sp. BL21I4N1]
MIARNLQIVRNDSTATGRAVPANRCTVFIGDVLASATHCHWTKVMIRKPVRIPWVAVAAAALSACVQTGPTYSVPAPQQVIGGNDAAQSDGDRALSKAVRLALARAPGFNVAGVFVRARDGAVFLSGTVHSADQIRQAEQIARTVPGVLVVSNKLTLWHGGNG